MLEWFLFLIFRALQGRGTVYCAILQIRKPRSERLSYLLKVMKGILSEVFPTPQFESFKHDAILVKIQGEFFFWGGEGGGSGSKNNVKYSHREES